MIQSLNRQPMTHNITLIPGDGIGPEVTQAAVRILEATGLKFEWETFEAGADAYAKYHEYSPPELIQSIGPPRIGLKRAVSTRIAAGLSSVKCQLRRGLARCASFRPIGKRPHLHTP